MRSCLRAACTTRHKLALTTPHRSLVNPHSLSGYAMTRSAPIIPVNAKMYRHFAIATVLITGTLAMFASGENREAMSDHLAARQHALAAQEAERNMTANGKGGNNKTNLHDKRKVKGTFSSDGDVVWKPPTAARGGGGRAATIEAELVAGDAAAFSGEGGSAAGPGSTTFSGSSAPPPGMSPQEYANMLNQKKKKKPGVTVREPTEQETNGLFAASKARSQTRDD
jgi:hypothetical protein